MHESVTLDQGGPVAHLDLVYRSDTVDQHPAILMLGSTSTDKIPFWATRLVDEGYMLVAFTVEYPPDPDPARRAQWLVFDQRFAHSYVEGGARAPGDTARVIDYLLSRGDVHPHKIGWLGSPSTGIPGLSVATREPRLAAIVAFVSTGAYRHWFETWRANGLWVGKTPDLWPETDELLKTVDPILHVDTLYPTAVLMVSGGGDKVVDPATARAFVEAARPYYRDDDSRLRLVIYDGFGHNLPLDVVTMYAENWFHLYMDPHKDPPKPALEARDLKQSVIQTQINSTSHQQLMNAE